MKINYCCKILDFKQLLAPFNKVLVFPLHNIETQHLA
jgi:hypothetical protein